MDTVLVANGSAASRLWCGEAVPVSCVVLGGVVEDIFSNHLLGV